MPRPPILPLIDWPEVLARGLDYFAWLATAEKPEHATAIDAARLGLNLPDAAHAALQKLAKPVRVVAIAEPWCGDVRRHVPVLQRLADASAGRLTVRYVRRDDPSGIFARNLTNGGEAIPRFVFLSSDHVETGTWGPMPAAARALVARGKAANDIPGARKLVTALYNADPGRGDVIAELLERLDVAATVRVGQLLSAQAAS